MHTMYVLTFDAEWRYDSLLVRGKQSYHVASSDGTIDMGASIAVCRILASQAGTLLLPENGIDVKTEVAREISYRPLWDDAGVKVY